MKHRSNCLEANLIEISAAREAFQEPGEPSGLEQPACPSCDAIYKKWAGFYRLLKNEMEKPVSPKVREFVKSVGQNKDPALS